MTKHHFGDYLRRSRETAGYRLGEFARLLGVSGPYLSDVELGNRAPFGTEHLAKIAELLPVDLRTLQVKAAETRGAFALEPVTEGHQRTGRALMRRWNELDTKKLEMIREIVGDIEEAEDEDEDEGEDTP